MTYDITGFSQQYSVDHPASEGTWRAIRVSRDGSLVTMPWTTALVLEGRVFGIQAGSVTTPIAGHAAIDADQPEAAVYIATAGTSLLPLYISMAMETGATTLAQGGMMCAISGISVGAGTSTAATPFNLKLGTVGYTTAVSAGVAYTGNGTDPLTAGNFLELKRVSAVIDSDAATSGIIPPVLEWGYQVGMLCPVVESAGSILAYGEAAGNTLFATIIWAELPESSLN